MRQNQINVNIAVDVLRALSEKSLCHSIYIMDDSPWGSIGKGTAELCTLCMPGETIHWKAYAIDLQTPVAIKDITFRPDEENCEEDVNPDLKTWTGIVPDLMPGRKYHYRLKLQMGNGKDSCMYIDGSSLLSAIVPLCEQENEHFKPLNDEL